MQGKHCKLNGKFEKWIRYKHHISNSQVFTDIYLTEGPKLWWQEHEIRAYFNFALIRDTLRTSMSEEDDIETNIKCVWFYISSRIPILVIMSLFKEGPSLFHPIQNNTCLLIIASSNCSAISHSDGFLNKEVRRWVKEMNFFSLAFWHHLGWVSVVRGCGLNVFSMENAWLPPWGRILFGSF